MNHIFTPYEFYTKSCAFAHQSAHVTQSLGRVLTIRHDNNIVMIMRMWMFDVSILSTQVLIMNGHDTKMIPYQISGRPR